MGWLMTAVGVLWQYTIGAILGFLWEKKDANKEAVEMADTGDTLDDGERL